MEKKELLYPVCGNVNKYSHYGEKVWHLFKNLILELHMIQLSHSWANGNPKEMKSKYKRNICIPMFIVSLFTIGKIWNQLRCPYMYIYHIFSIYTAYVDIHICVYIIVINTC